MYAIYRGSVSQDGRWLSAPLIESGVATYDAATRRAKTLSRRDVQRELQYLYVVQPSLHTRFGYGRERPALVATAHNQRRR